VPDEPAADYPRDAVLPEDAVLVRGGPLDFDRLRSAAGQPLKRHGFYGLSVFSFPGVAEPVEIFRRSRLQYPEICVSTVRDVREVGCEVRRTFNVAGHCSIIFPGEPSDDDIRAVMELLEPSYTIEP
jgi:hypothetical protein